MSTKRFLAAAIAQVAVLAAGAAHAQEANEPPQADTLFYIANGAVPIMPLGGTIDIVAGAGSVMGEVVTGKPYSADSITNSTQMLADGNRITATNRARVYRDSEGRTRREQQLDAVGVWQPDEPLSMITINDPVKNVSYFLDPRAQTARELKPFRFNERLERRLEILNEAQSGQDERDSEGRRERLRAPPPLPEGRNVMVREWAGGAPGADVKIEVGGGAGREPFDVALPPGVVPGQLATRRQALAFGTASSFAAAAEPVPPEDLGEQVLEGVLARGTRRTQTIAAGAIGNELPIEIVHEEWYAPELEAIVLRRDVDPRFGETTYRLVNVDRSEPSPELFMIPQDYSIQTEPAPPMVGTRALRSEPAPEAGGAAPRPGRRVFLVQPDPAAEPANGE
jgi:hypothetical protein